MRVEVGMCADTNTTHSDQVYPMKASSVTLAPYSYMTQEHENEYYQLSQATTNYS